MGPLRDCLLPSDEGKAGTSNAIHPQSRAFLVASAFGAVLQVLEEQVQAAMAFKVKGSVSMRANLVSQLDLDIELLAGEVRAYEVFGQQHPKEESGLLESVSMLLFRIKGLRSSWCSV